MRIARVSLLLLASSCASVGGGNGPPGAVNLTTPASGRNPSDAGAVASELTPPESFPVLARQILRARMEHHGRDLVTLVQAVVMLQLDLVAELAEGIASEPRLVRPTSEGADQLNSALPERFFVLQDELYLRAKAVAEAARRKNRHELGPALGRLTETCVACHSAYREPSPR